MPVQARKVRKGWVTVRAASIVLGCSPRTILRRVKDGTLQGVVARVLHYTDDRPRKTKRVVEYVTLRSLETYTRELYAGLRKQRKRRGGNA